LDRVTVATTQLKGIIGVRIRRTLFCGGKNRMRVGRAVSSSRENLGDLVPRLYPMVKIPRSYVAAKSKRAMLRSEAKNLFGLDLAFAERRHCTAFPTMPSASTARSLTAAFVFHKYKQLNGLWRPSLVYKLP
jgi:hypothetical protein